MSWKLRWADSLTPWENPRIQSFCPMAAVTCGWDGRKETPCRDETSSHLSRARALPLPGSTWPKLNEEDILPRSGREEGLPVSGSYRPAWPNRAALTELLCHLSLAVLAKSEDEFAWFSQRPPRDK